MEIQSGYGRLPALKLTVPDRLNSSLSILSSRIDHFPNCIVYRRHDKTYNRKAKRSFLEPFEECSKISRGWRERGLRIMVYRISVSESILYDSYLFKVAIIECFYCCMCVYKIIESFSNRCLLYQRERERERRNGNFRLFRPEKASNTIDWKRSAWNQLRDIKKRKKKRRRKEGHERFVALLNPSIQFWVATRRRELPAFRGKCTLPRRERLWRTLSWNIHLPVVSPPLEFPSMDEIILSYFPRLLPLPPIPKNPANPTKLHVSQWVEESYGSVYRSRLSLTRFPSRALTLGGREGLKKSFSSSTANPLTCLDAMSIYRTTLVLPCFFFPLLPLATVIPCRVFLEKFYTPFTAPSSKSKLTNQFFTTITISRRTYSRYRSLERNITTIPLV